MSLVHHPEECRPTYTSSVQFQAQSSPPPLSAGGRPGRSDRRGPRNPSAAAAVRGLLFRVRIMSPRLRLLLPLLAACGGADPQPHLLWDPGAGEMAAFPDDTFTVADPEARTGLRIRIDPAEVPEL